MPGVFWMFHNATDSKPLLAIINSQVMLTNKNFKLGSSLANSAVSCCDDSSAAQDGSSTEGNRPARRHKTNLGKHINYGSYYMHFPTCHGYSLASVSTPPTILFTLLGIPHFTPKVAFSNPFTYSK